MAHVVTEKSEVSRRWSELSRGGFSGHREGCTRKGCWAAVDHEPHEFAHDWTVEGAPIHGRAVASGLLPDGTWRIYLEAIGDAPWTVRYVRTRAKDGARRLLRLDDFFGLGRDARESFLTAMEKADKRRIKLNAKPVAA